MKTGQNKSASTEPELVIPIKLRMPVIKLYRVKLTEDNLMGNGVSET